MRRTLVEGDDVATVVRGASGESLVLVIDAGWAPLALALAKAALAPLAIERAPAMRVNMVFAGEGADPAAVEGAIAFLERAVSTTGQLLEVG